MVFRERKFRFSTKTQTTLPRVHGRHPHLHPPGTLRVQYLRIDTTLPINAHSSLHAHKLPHQSRHNPPCFPRPVGPLGVRMEKHGINPVHDPGMGHAILIILKGYPDPVPAPVSPAGTPTRPESLPQLWPREGRLQFLEPGCHLLPALLHRRVLGPAAHHCRNETACPCRAGREVRSLRGRDSGTQRPTRSRFISSSLRHGSHQAYCDGRGPVGPGKPPGPLPAMQPDQDCLRHGKYRTLEKILWQGTGPPGGQLPAGADRPGGSHVTKEAASGSWW